MEQIETLNLIRARCVELLEQAKLRTPGAWARISGDVFTDTEEAKNGKAGHHIADADPGNDKSVAQLQADATYIANASVAFEAALESTVAAINLIESAADICSHDYTPMAEVAAGGIITAWKHLLP